MQHSVKITADGQMTLPDEVLKALGVGPGDRVDLVENADGTFALRARRGRFADLRGIVKTDRKITSEELDQWIKDVRAGAGEVRDDWD